MSREAMTLALEALEERYVGALRDKAMDALRAALDAPNEPVWIQRTHLEWARREPSMCRLEPTQRLPDFIPLYPAQREWQGLTDEELFDLWVKSPAETEHRFAFVKAALAKQKEKNT